MPINPEAIERILNEAGIETRVDLHNVVQALLPIQWGEWSGENWEDVIPDSYWLDNALARVACCS